MIKPNLTRKQAYGMIMPIQNGNGSAVGTNLNIGTSHINPQVTDYLLPIIWRSRWIVLFTTIVALTAAIVYIAKATPIYTSTSRIYVQQSGPKILTEDEQGFMTQSNNFLYTQLELLKSLPILDEVLNNPRINQAKTLAGIDNPTGYLKNNLNTKVGRKDDIIYVSFDSPYPDEAAIFVNAIVEAYVKYQGTGKRSTSAEVLRILQVENTNLLEEVSRKRQTMLDFKQKNTALAFESNEGNVVLERLNRLSQELTEAQLATIESESAYEHTKEMLSDTETLHKFVEAQLAQVVDWAMNNQLVELNARLSDLELSLANRLSEVQPRHPTVRLLEVEIANLKAQIDDTYDEFAQAQLALMEQKYLTAKDKEDKITKYYADQCQLALDLSQQTDQYEMLRLDWEQSKTLCDNLSSRIKELSVTEDVGALNISVIEVARPSDKPSEPQKAGILTIALIIGLMLGVGLSLLRDFVDQRLRSIEEIAAVLGKPVLGIVPSMSRRHGIVSRGQKVHKDPNSPEAEAYRDIRTALFFGTFNEQAKQILVTSPTPGDGKTTLASNLAITMAQAGQRVLIIDADLRKPMQHKIFKMNHEQKGLSSVIIGRVTIEDGIQPSGIDGLDLLLSGIQVSNHSELLNSKSFGQLLEIVAQKYDRIIIDSPPVMSVTDAQIIAAICDLTLLVLRAEKSTRNVSRQALNKLLSVGGYVPGVVVNDVKRKSKYGKYAGFDYYNGYYVYGNNKGKKVQDSEPEVNIRKLNSHCRSKLLPEGRHMSLNQRSQELVDLIRAYTQPQFGSESDEYSQFTQRNCERWTGLSRTTIQRRLADLVDSGKIDVDTSSKPYKYRITDQELAKTVDFVLSSSENILEPVNDTAYYPDG